MRATLHKSELLRGKSNFQQIFEKGKKFSGKHIRYFILERGTSKELSSSLLVGFVVRRTVSLAVDRNRIKRLLRESYRKNKTTLQAAVHNSPVALSIVFMYAPSTTIPVRSVKYISIENEMKSTLKSIAQLYHR